MNFIRAFVLTAAAAAVAPSAGAAVVTSVSARGTDVFASFAREVPITCADGSDGFFFENVSVQANEQTIKDRGAAPVETNTVSVFYSTFDSCTSIGTFLLGSADDAYVQDRLNSASIVASVPLTDESGNVVTTAELDLTLSGVGDVRSNRFNSRSTFPLPDGTVVTIDRFNGKTRDAVVSGSVVVDGTEFIDLSTFASLSQSRSSTTQLTR